MSASSSPARLPSCASATARLAATVDLPTPPLPLATAMIRLTPGTARGPRLRRRVPADLQVGRRLRRRRPVRGQERRDRGDAGQRRDRGLGGGAGRLEPRALRRVDLEQEAHPVGLDRQRPHHVGVDDAAAGAGHRHRAQRREDGVAGDGISGSCFARLRLDRTRRRRRQGPAAPPAPTPRGDQPIRGARNRALRRVTLTC